MSSVKGMGEGAGAEGRWDNDAEEVISLTSRRAHPALQLQPAPGNGEEQRRWWGGGGEAEERRRGRRTRTAELTSTPAREQGGW